MDKKTKPIYMLPTRDPPQNKIYTQTESTEKDMLRKWKQTRKPGVVVLTYIRQNRLPRRDYLR